MVESAGICSSRAAFRCGKGSRSYCYITSGGHWGVDSFPEGFLRLRLPACCHRAASMDGDEAGRAVTLFQMAATGDGGGSTTVQLAHTQDRECGGHILQISCGLWVYNCTGMPLALLQDDLDDSRQQEPNEVRPFKSCPKCFGRL